jgi:hypothetical protein
MTILGRDRYGCPTHKEEGPARCANGRTVPAADVERRPEGLRSNLCEPTRIAQLAQDYVDELARRRRSTARLERQRQRQLAVLEREQKQLVTSLGRVPPAAMDAVVEQLGGVSERIEALRAEQAALGQPEVVVDFGEVSGAVPRAQPRPALGSAPLRQDRRERSSGCAPGAGQPDPVSSRRRSRRLHPLDRGGRRGFPWS